MHDYINLRVDVSPASEDATDLLAAFLADIGFDFFEPDDSGLNAYILKQIYDPERVREILNDFPMNVKFDLKAEEIKGRDWNEEWEKNYFKPIAIDNDVVVRSSFHTDVPDARFEILIDPKMAFGTGHHATTSNMLRLILKENLENKSVIDMGTGTGILAFLCKMKGASEVTAIEIDPFAVENAVENATLNNLDIKIVCGDASSLETLGKVDLFMANINRNIIVNDLPAYTMHLKKDGIMFLSGFYTEDIPVVEKVASKLGLSVVDHITQDNWVAIKLIFSN